MAEESFDNRFRHGKCRFHLGETSPLIVGVSGARLEKAILDEEIGPEIVLFLTDSTPFAHELKRERFDLRLKSGAAGTSAGPVLFLLWWVPPVTNGKPFALYEHLLNPAHRGTLEGLKQLARQTHLHLVLIGPGQELLDVFEFENTFGVEKLIPISESMCQEHGASMDFAAAKQEYDQTYDLMELFGMSEPGDAESTGAEAGGRNETGAATHERYSFDSDDRALLTAAVVLLKKVAGAAMLRPAEMVSVAKLQHVFSLLPRVTPNLEVKVSVIGPWCKFDEIETWHYWDIATEGEQLSISSGGHFYDPRTGGDSFTTMNWNAAPGEPAVCEDYRGELWMVPDVQSFPEGVTGIDFTSRPYRIEIADSDNPLLGKEEDSEEDAEPNRLSAEDLADDTGDHAVDGLDNDRLHNGHREFADPISAGMSAQKGQIPLEEDTTFPLCPNAGDYLLCIRCTDPSCQPPTFDIIDFWEFREGDRLLITNREEDYPAAAEQIEEGGPSLWKVLPGDRLAWVGWRGQSNERKPTLVALVNCCQEGYVYGEPASPTLASVMFFGTPTSEATPEIRTLWMVGYDAAVAL